MSKNQNKFTHTKNLSWYFWCITINIITENKKVKSKSRNIIIKYTDLKHF